LLALNYKKTGRSAAHFFVGIPKNTVEN
jgi:hypothetical protein